MSSTAVTTTMVAAEREEDRDEFIELRPLIGCHNIACQAKNPRKRCTRCKSAYFCSVECQRSHWKKGGHKKDCFDLDVKRAEWKEEWALPHGTSGARAPDESSLKKNQYHQHVESTGSNAGTTGSAISTTTCGICLEDTILQPAVLECGHVFCFTCISELQEHRVVHPNSRSKKACPNCRSEIKEDVVMEAMRHAYLYLQHADRLLDTDVDERNEMYRLASIEVDKIFAGNPDCQMGRIRKADILMKENPNEAIAMIRQLFEWTATARSANSS